MISAEPVIQLPRIRLKTTTFINFGGLQTNLVASLMANTPRAVLKRIVYYKKYISWNMIEVQTWVADTLTGNVTVAVPRTSFARTDDSDEDSLKHLDMEVRSCIVFPKTTKAALDAREKVPQILHLKLVGVMVYLKQIENMVMSW